MCRLQILRWIPSVSGIYTRFPCSANKHACPICRARQGQSFHLDEAASVLRVAHVPQKPWYVILGTIIDFPCLAKCQTKEVLGSDNIRFACTQKWQTYKSACLLACLLAQESCHFCNFQTALRAWNIFLSSSFPATILHETLTIVKRWFCRNLSEIPRFVFHIIPCIFSLSVLEWFYRICIH